MTPTLVSSSAARGRLRIVFIATHDDGTVFGPFVELRPIGENSSAFLTAFAAALLQQLKDGEIADRLSRIVQDGSLAVVPAFRFAALSDIQAALRTFFATAVKVDAIMVADYLATLTDAQLRVLFSMTAGQVTTLRANKLTPAVTLAANIRAASGA